LSLELLVADLSRRGLCKDVKLRPTAAVTGTVLPEVRTHLSQHDVKGAFVTAQQNPAQEEQGALDFNGFVLCLALCGHIKYDEVEGMGLKQRVAGILANFLGDRDEQQVLTHALVPTLERLDCTSVEPPGGLEPEKHARFISCWQSMDLSRVVGFPLWERQVFHLLHRAFGDISSIFAAYARPTDAVYDAAYVGLASTHAVDDTLSQSTLTSLALDCGLATDAFPMVRVQTVFQRAGQAEEGKVGYRALELHEFLEAVVQLAFSRANPRGGEVGHERVAPAHPLPACLEQMLQKNLLKRAMRNGLAKVKVMVGKDPAVRKVMRSEAPKLKSAFEATCRKGPRRYFGKSLLGVDLLLGEMRERKVQRDIHVTPVPAFRGMEPPEVHTQLSALDVKGAFVTCQGAEHGEEGALTIDFEAFLVCLALCGHVKYEEVEQMSLAQRVAGIVANFLGEKDEQQVLTEVLAPRAERLSTAGVLALPGMDAAVHALFMGVWAKMDLGHLFGFPLWEKAVFMLLHRSFPELQSIFVTYSKRGTADSGSLETMQQTELVDLALDCGLATAAFPMARVQLVFDGKAGDQALELHEFLGVVVQLSFCRANPRFGEVGHERVAPAHPLPDCLDVMLQQNLLRKAKQDSLVKIKKMASKEPAVLAVLRPLRAQLRRRFTQLLASGSEKDLARSRQEAMSVEMFCTDLFDRGVTKEITLRPTAAVKGALLPEVHSSLSHLDAKRAFAISQDGGDIINSAQTVSFDEYVTALVLCGHMKYEEVEGMTLAQRVAGVVANLLGEKSEEQVITEAVAPRVERFDLAEAKAEDGLLSPDDHHRFLQAWSRMDLSHVHGFPLWEKAVFHTLHSSFSGIRSLFNQYAKHSGGAVASKSLQQTELVNMALDCCIATAAFPMPRVQAAFTLADLKADGKIGDGALELHEFLEALVQLAFSRANPRFGEVGHERVAPAHPLPACLEQMLTQKLLQGAKRSGLAAVKGEMLADPEVLALFKP
jgi:hypothetical protein